MKTARLPAVLSLALSALAAVQAAPFSTFSEACGAIDKAIRDQHYAEAERLVGVATPLAKNAGETNRLFDLTTRAYAEIGAPKRAALVKLALPVVDGCTNFTSGSGTTRAAFTRAFDAAFDMRDMKTVAHLLEVLAQDREVTRPVFELWSHAAMKYADDALVQRERKPVEQAELIAGFRAEGSTFGLNNTPLEIDGKPALDQARLLEAEAILMKLMPQTDLATGIQGRRLGVLHEIQMKAGSPAGQLASIENVKQFALAVKPVDLEGTNAVESAVRTTFEFRRDRGEWREYAVLAREYGAKLASLYTREGCDLMQGRELGAYYRAHDETAFNALAAALAKRPANKTSLATLLLAKDTIQYRAPDPAWPTVAALFQPLTDRRADFGHEDRQPLAEILYHAAKAAGDVKGLKQYYAEMEKIKADSTAAWAAENAREKAARDAKAPFTRNPAVSRPVDGVNRITMPHLAFLDGIKDYESALPLREASSNPNNPASILDLAANYYVLGRSQEAIATAARVATNAAARGETRFGAMIIQAMAKAKDVPGFRQTLLGYRAFSDALGTASETTLEADTRYFNFLRAGAKLLYTLHADPAHVAYIKAMVDLTREMQWPEERLLYTATFVDAAPQSAEGALATGLFDKYPVETRMAKYAVYDYMGKDKELALLKAGAQPRLQADVPGKEGGVVVLCDTLGVHFYVRLNDPDAARSREGYADGANLEFSIMPGETTSWNWNLVTVRNPRNQYDVEWDSPMPGRKLTCDYLAVDSVSTDKSHVFHIFAPWVMYYDRLPRNGDTWRFVCCAGWAGQFGALGGGSVHELGRGMQVKFDISPRAAEKIRGGVVKQAVGEYHKVRDPWENAEFWGDPHMGDEAFHAAVVRPFLAGLDANAKIVTGGQLTQAETDRLYTDCIRDFADFRLMLDARREAYLKAELFAEQE